MTTTASPPVTTFRTMSDLLHELGDVPPERVLMNPLPGTATEQDVLDLDDHEDRICELIDGVLLEKPMGAKESLLACYIIMVVNSFVLPRKLGVVLGETGMLKLRARLVLIPDVAFIFRTSFPGGQLPKEAIFPVAPDLAVEVLSKSNPKAEMARKRRQYFDAGTKLVWEVDPVSRTVTVYTAPDQSVTLQQTQTLDGGTVLPGLTISLTELFGQLDQWPFPQD